MTTHTKIPIIYYFKMDKSEEEFIHSLLSAFDFNRIGRNKHYVKIIDTRIEVKKEEMIMEYYMLLELSLSSIDSISTLVNGFTDDLDKFLGALDQKFTANFEYSKRVYL